MKSDSYFTGKICLYKFFPLLQIVNKFFFSKNIIDADRRKMAVRYHQQQHCDNPARDDRRL